MTVVMRGSAPALTKLFPEAAWAEISGRVGDAFRMTEAEKKSFAEGRIARLIAAIPFLAGCEEAERTAAAHLGTYLLSLRETKSYFNASAGDGLTVLERLRLISNFKGGDARIIERGLCLLALNMVSDYQRDIEEDAALGKYNPISAGAWDYKDTVIDLKYRIMSVECEEMEELSPIDMVPMSFWGR
jgi:hypothetical protein